MALRWLITGGSRGIGEAVARLAHARGDRVAVLARGQSVEAAAERTGAELALRADVSDAQSVRSAFAVVEREWGGLDVLVNNAGTHRGGRVDRLAREDWDAVLATNLTGTFECIRAALELMPEPGGSIVNVGAVVGFRGFPGDAPYGAAKAGLVGLTRVLAIELARRHVRVNLVVPGFVETEMTGELSGRARDNLLARIPLGRPARAEEIADTVCWVAGSSYMTGAIVSVDGGLGAALGSAA